MKNLLLLFLALFISGVSWGQLSGIKTIQPTGGDYATFTLAINALNTSGVGAGGVTFHVAAGEVFTENCPVITATGTAANPVIFQKSGVGANPVISSTGSSGTTDAGIAIRAGDYFTFDGIDVRISSGTALELGYYVYNQTATNGAQHITIKNCNITLDRTNTNSKGIYQNVAVNPTNVTGANSYNTFDNNYIRNAYSGIYIKAGLGKPDLNCVVSNNIIGGPNANDIGNGSTITSGIRINNVQDISVFNNEIRNVSVAGTFALYGLYMEVMKGTLNQVYNNNIHNITSYSYAYTSPVYGLRADVYSTGVCNFYNNSISGLQHGSTSPDLASIVVHGIAFGIAIGNLGAGTGNFYYNSVSINEDEFPPTACFYWGGYGILNLKNNIFANYSTAGTTPKYDIYIVGGSLTSSDYNDFYITSGTNNFVGNNAGTTYSTMADWQTGLGLDANSLGSDPQFTTTTNLLPVTGSPVIAAGSPISGFTTDITGAPRSLTAPTIGAYEVSTLTWTGATDTDWNTSTNWNPEGVPFASTNVVIPNVTNDPIVNQATANPAQSNHLTIDPGAILTINSGKSITINGTLSNNAGVSGLVLKSDATGTASLMHNTSNIDATIERYLTGNTAINGTFDFHLVSIPLNAPVTSAQFNDMYLYEFNTTTQAWVSLGSSTTTPLNNNAGYMVFYPNTNTTIYFTGQLNNGTFTASTPTDAADEFSLVPNPYPSAIDWDAATGWTKTNLQDAFYIWNPVSNNYVTWSAGAGTAGSGKIPVGQSFFVKSNAASPVLEMNNDIRIHDEQSYYKNSSKMIPEVLHLHISDAESADEIIVRFSSMIGNEPGLFDVDKLYGAESAPQLYSMSEVNDKLTINAMDHSSQTVIVPVGLEYSKNGQLEFVASGFESFESSASIFLEDKLLNKMIDLKESPSYIFNHNTMNDALRFNLHFYGVNATGEVTEDDYHIWPVSDHLNINIPACAGQKALVEVFDLLGHRIHSEQNVLQAPTEISLPHFNGIAIVRVTTNNKIYSEKVFIR